METEKTVIAVVGLGYVGLPLAVAFGRTGIPTLGYDISASKIESLKRGVDPNHELTEEEMRSTRVAYSNDPSIIAQADVIIAAIPTPVTSAKVPDLEPLKSASRTIGEHMKKGCVVVFESTVYPGATEEVCVPILEQVSGLKFGEDFKAGYSPERINPGDREHTLENITKIVSGSDEATLTFLSDLYGKVVKAGIYPAPSIKVAEAAKVIENIQRDLNIALVNELSTIFHKIGIDTGDVLKAAGTKWNFHRYTPGLVGGHCIGVDPYYLTYKAEELGYHPQIILAGRRVNDEMAARVAEYVMMGLSKAGRCVTECKVLVLGVTFKENVADIRNSKTQDLIRELENYGMEVHAHDPLISPADIEKKFGARPIENLDGPAPQDGPRGAPHAAIYDAMILCSPHQAIVDRVDRLAGLLKNPGVFMDIKGTLKGALGANPQVIYQAL